MILATRCKLYCYVQYWIMLSRYWCSSWHGRCQWITPGTCQSSNSCFTVACTEFR